MKLRRYWGLGRRHFGILCRAFATVLYFRLALIFRKYKDLAKSIAVTIDSSANPASAIHPSPYVIGWAVRHTARIVPFASCLTQALAVQHLLARTGVLVPIRIGVRTTDKGSVAAHAWVIYNGTILIGGPQSNIDRYSVMTDLTPG